jgi:hypothetical protein
MTPEQLAAYKDRSARANELNRLATKAAGLGVTSAEAQRAQAALIEATKDAKGRPNQRKVKQLQEDALVRAGAKPKGLSRWFS